MSSKLRFPLFFLLFCFSGYSQSTTPDPDFGTAGKTAFAFGENDSMLTNIALQPDGKIVACGRYYYLQPGDIMDDSAVCRFNANGTLDTAFGVQGKIMLPGGPYSEFISTDMKIRNDGKILILGYTLTYDDSNANAETILLQYHPDGTPDMTFGVGGRLHVNSGTGNNAGNVLLIQEDNKIIIGGNVEAEAYNFAVIRLNPDGVKDSSFGSNGLVSINLGTEADSNDISSDTVADIQLLADGKMIVGGSTKKNFPHNRDTLFALVRLDQDGAVDTSFGNNGHVFTNFGNFGDEMQGLHVLADQKMIAVGTDYSDNLLSKKIIIAKYNTDGSLDNSYGQQGKVIFTNDNTYPRFEAAASLINTTGQLVIGGTGNALAATAFQKPIVLRFTEDGNPDNAFAPNGLYTEDFNFYPADIALQPDGKLLVAGTKFNDANIREFAVSRYESGLLNSKAFDTTDFSVYPNPFEDFIDIDFKLLQDEKFNMKLTDITGREINSVSDQHIFQQGQHTFRFTVTETLQSGVYFFHISDGRNATTFKMIKRL